MKTLLSRMNCTLFAAWLVMAALLSSCKTDPSSLSGPNLPLSEHGGSGGSTYTGNPKIVIVGDSLIKYQGSTYDVSTLAVTDSTGQNYRSLLVQTPQDWSASKGSFSCPRWSPSGGHVCYLYSAGTVSQGGQNWGGFNNITTGTVSVSSSGPTIGSVSTLMTPYLNGDTILYSIAAWTSQSNGMIAVAGNKFADKNIQNGGTPCKIWLISSSGGSPSLLYTGNDTEYCESLSWSPDGTLLTTTIRMGGIGNYRFQMRIINSSTGVVAASYDSTSTGFPSSLGYARWSNSGKNQIAFLGAAYQGTPYIYTYDYGTSTLSSAITTGDNCCWNPSNSKFLYYRPNTLSPTGSFTYTISSATMTQLYPLHGITAYNSADWRRD